MMNYEQAQQVSSSNIWVIVKDELDYRIEVYLSKLKTCASNEFRDIQLRLQIFEEIKRLPEDCKEREHSVPDRP